jgi:hypothetical protein
MVDSCRLEIRLVTIVTQSKPHRSIKVYTKNPVAVPSSGIVPSLRSAPFPTSPISRCCVVSPPVLLSPAPLDRNRPPLDDDLNDLNNRHFACKPTATGKYPPLSNPLNRKRIPLEMLNNSSNRHFRPQPTASGSLPLLNLLSA